MTCRFLISYTGYVIMTLSERNRFEVGIFNLIVVMLLQFITRLV